MSGRKNKKLRRELRENKAERNIKLRQMESLPYIQSTSVVEYLREKFRGKAGYKYISISKVGSLFLQPEYANIVPIIMHRNMPTITAMGRFNDGNNKELAIGLVKVTEAFPGLVIDRSTNVYFGGSLTPFDGDPLLPNPFICDLQRVTVDECNRAMQTQEEIYNKRLQDLMDNAKERVNRILHPENPYEDVTPYTENPYEDNPISETTEYLSDTSTNTKNQEN
jgi:hypothetical protein